ncbi:hypothetical protein JCM8547_002992 [Rhodosporidiobolus lusitaniae]
MEGSSRAGIPVRASYLYINRRIYRVARPLWFRHLTVPEDPSLGEAFLVRLLGHRDVHPHVELVYSAQQAGHSTLQLAIIASLPNLKHLHVMYDDPPTPNENSITFVSEDDIQLEVAETDVLKHFRNLQSLRLGAKNDERFLEMDDTSFDFQRSVPSLRYLECDQITTLTLFFEKTYSAFDTISLQLNELMAVEDVVIPWSIAKHLRFTTAVYDQWGGLNHVVSELHSVYPNIPLRSLIMNVKGITKLEKLRIGDVFDAEHFQSILEHLRPVPHFRHLELGVVDDIWWYEASSVRVNTPTAGAIVLTNPTERRTHFSAFYTLFDGLKQSDVREVRYKGKGEKMELRWTRAGKDEEFREELWWL